MTTTLPHGVVLDKGPGGLPWLRVATDLCTAEMSLLGAHLCRWQPRGHAHPVLWMSGQSAFELGKPIRGGVPICFPWFGPRAGDPRAPGHGCARTQAWTLESVTREYEGATVARLSLAANDTSRAYIPDDFELRYVARLGCELSLSLTVVNRGSTTFVIEEALHTYLAVSDARHVEITGLAGATYIDKTVHMSRKLQGAEPITIAAETDRLYVDTSSAITVVDSALERRIVVSKSGSQSSVVWNPWVAKSKAMPDFGDDEWPGMLCIETVNAADNAVTLLAGQSHTMKAVVRVLPLETA
jgi:glucose-6-phosphate 1-epimerase